MQNTIATHSVCIHRKIEKKKAYIEPLLLGLSVFVSGQFSQMQNPK